MARLKKRDCWTAHLRVSVPIDAANPGTISSAQQKVREIANLIPGSAVEITHAGFGRMAAAERAAVEIINRGPESTIPEIQRIGSPTKAVNDPPEIPAFLRRNGTEPEARELDPSIDVR